MGRAGVIPTFVVAGLLHALPAAAQRFSLAPEIGVYIPTEKLIDASNGTVGELEGGFSLGARIGLWVGDRIGLNVSGACVPTTGGGMLGSRR